jgi:TRAP-type uncharacterized transport system fused permease subunit
MGVPLLQAHLFPLYYALFSHLTPPVGIGLMVACKMADSDYLKSAVEGLKAAFPSFFLPFLFVYSPGILLLGDSAGADVMQIVGCVLFFFAMAVVMNRYFAGACSLAEMVLLLVSFGSGGWYLADAAHPGIYLAGCAVTLVAALAMNVSRTKKTIAA